MDEIDAEPPHAGGGSPRRPRGRRRNAQMLHTFRTNVIEGLVGRPVASLRSKKKCCGGASTTPRMIPTGCTCRGPSRPRWPADLAAHRRVLNRAAAPRSVWRGAERDAWRLQRRPEYDENGGRLFPQRWIDWRAVVSRCAGRASDRGAVRGVPSAEGPPPRVGALVPGWPPPGPAPPSSPPSSRLQRSRENPGCHMRGPWSKFASLWAASPTISAAATGGGPESHSCGDWTRIRPHAAGGPSPSSFSLPGGLVSMAVILAADTRAGAD